MYSTGLYAYASDTRHQQNYKHQKEGHKQVAFEASKIREETRQVHKNSYYRIIILVRQTPAHITLEKQRLQR